LAGRASCVAGFGFQSADAQSRILLLPFTFYLSSFDKYPGALYKVLYNNPAVRLFEPCEAFYGIYSKMPIDFEYFGESEPEPLLMGAITTLKEGIEEYTNRRIDMMTLFVGTRIVWKNLNKNPYLQGLVEKEIEKKRVAFSSIFALDSSNEDPVRKRYEPDLWLDSIPKEFEGNPNPYILDRCKTLLTFLEGLNSQK